MDKEIKKILLGCKKYLQQTNEEARLKYYKLMGKFYMDDKQWEIMQETRDLLVKIDSLLGGRNE